MSVLFNKRVKRCRRPTFFTLLVLLYTFFLDFTVKTQGHVKCCNIESAFALSYSIFCTCEHIFHPKIIQFILPPTFFLLAAHLHLTIFPTRAVKREIENLEIVGRQMIVCDNLNYEKIKKKTLEIEKRDMLN